MFSRSRFYASIGAGLVAFASTTGMVDLIGKKTSIIILAAGAFLLAFNERLQGGKSKKPKPQPAILEGNLSKRL